MPLFSPRSVAVVGASRDPASLGHRTLSALVASGFKGPVYPVNPKATSVGSIRAYPSVSDIPDRVDLAVILVPRDLVLDIVEECGQQGVRGLVVITAGFAETGPEGRKLQHRLCALVRKYGMRMVGPNCMGLLSTDPEVRLNATFAPVFPPAGGIGLLSQSGALGLAILGQARHRGVGLSSFVSVGNKADVSGNDLLEYWEDDEGTRVILLYLESFGNPHRFARIARRVTRSKPIVAVKGGRTVAGRRAAGSHTAALAGSDAAVDALFRQTGVVRARTLDEMFDVALGLDCQPLPAGRRLAIVTNAGGPGILCADAAEAGGLEVPELPAKTRESVAALLPASASVGNPVDMIASAGPAAYGRTVATVLGADEIDALIVIYTPIEAAQTPEYLDAISAGLAEGRRAGGGGKPMYVCMMTEGGQSEVTELGGERVPMFPFPEEAARALAKVADYAALRMEDQGDIRAYSDFDVAAARAVCAAALEARGSGWLTADETRRLLTAVGLPGLPGGVARTPDEAVALAEEVGFPVAVKLASHTIVHKTDVDVVRLGLADSAAVRDAFHGIRGRLAEVGREADMEGVLIQPMVQGGVEVMVGTTTDRTFGALVSFGLGGIHVEILHDVSFRVAPVTDLDAQRMVREIRGYRLLEGYRGHPPADVAAIEEVVQRASRLVEAVPQVRELDLNPLFALPPGQGCAVVDARVRVGRPATRRRRAISRSG